ncbi:MAG: hypothetical protein ETSY1_08850 [Candidatus Entotheonella factor]|uniref:Uncharacterized protein n=1 Tax=Entotheonella factor TaxID=1429438 RepID=W4LUF2_ENTF1|nr:MAG: hypothetical protein ETSY1_08850 [Candidatus Entotheonella factor]
MVTSEKKTHVTEIVAGIIAVLGLGAGVTAWFLGANTVASAGVAIGFLLPSGMFALAGEGLRTGQMGMKGNKIYRDKSPLKFWGFAIFYVLIGCMFFFFVLMMLLLSV